MEDSVPGEVKDLTFREFCDLCGEIYDELPEIIKDRFGVLCEEFPVEYNKQTFDSGIAIFGYFHPYLGESIMMCYWGFKMTHNFDRDHVARVMKHEFEHRLMGHTSQPHKHSEHR